VVIALWCACLLHVGAVAPAEATAAPASVPAETAAEVVRIAVGRFRDAVVITGQDLRAVSSLNEPIDGKGARRRIELKAGPKGMVVDGKSISTEVVRIVVAEQLELSGHRYHRELEVRWQRYDKHEELLVVHPLDIETYVVGIVASEVPSSWSLAAYQAQAVAARTFAVFQKYRRLDLPYHMESSVLDQVYAGAEREHPQARAAVASTRGLVLSHHRRLVPTYFHASCGGQTESALEVWGGALETMPGSVCGRCDNANRAKWTGHLSAAEVDKAWSKRLREPVARIEVAERTASGRARQIALFGAKRKILVSGAEFRRVHGGMRLFSTVIDGIERKGNNWVVRGRGSGHGVGLCQWGAQGSAEAGDDYLTILQRYYPGAVLFRLF
jgi:stage II sporulation protein D